MKKDHGRQSATEQEGTTRKGMPFYKTGQPVPDWLQGPLTNTAEYAESNLALMPSLLPLSALAAGADLKVDTPFQLTSVRYLNASSHFESWP